jgi:vancomycin resistance protein VanJ
MTRGQASAAAQERFGEAQGERSTTDRGLASLRSRLTSVQDEAGTGFGFSRPAAFPVARIDHILTRGVAPTDARTLPATGSDHRPVAARLKA